MVGCRLGGVVLKMFKQCCGAGYALIWLSWIRIRSGNTDPGPRERKLTNIYIQTNLIFSPFKKAFVPSRYVLWPITYTKYIYHVKIQLLSDGKVWPGSGSALKPMQIYHTLFKAIKNWYFYITTVCRLSWRRRRKWMWRRRREKGRRRTTTDSFGGITLSTPLGSTYVGTATHPWSQERDC